ncbi:XTP/dITP diphosphatase [Candidatus Micrarchaeota archaeon]|nr:XTP/dITP diphosphatase [Candidatus Micrarchaeota archaeon]
MVIYFATSNEHKFKEANEILSAKGISVEHFNFKHNEIRSDSLEEIAMEAVDTTFAQLKKPVFVEDTGLFIDALNGFPGTYSAWALKKIGSDGILKLLKSASNRAATFKTCIAFANGKITKTFLGECKGAIATKKRGKSGFGYDPIFTPKGYKKTFAEDLEIKVKVSHRFAALQKLTEFLKA